MEIINSGGGGRGGRCISASRRGISRLAIKGIIINTATHVCQRRPGGGAAGGWPEDEDVKDDVAEDGLGAAPCARAGLFGGLGGGEWLYLRLRGGFGGPKTAVISPFLGDAVRPMVTEHGCGHGTAVTYSSLTKA